MTTRSEKTQRNKVLPTIVGPSANGFVIQSDDNDVFSFQDNRPGTVAQSPLYKMAQDNPTIEQGMAFQKMSEAGMSNKAITQLMAGDQRNDTATIHKEAQKGVQGKGAQLPFIEKIQQSFGHHSISHVKSYSGVNAAAANRSIGAEAYATGNKVAFASPTPDLFTTAHEAAHAIQQQGGVQLSGGVGEVGDQYELHADAVAERVVQGKSSEDLLDRFNRSPHRSNYGNGVNAPIQRLIGVEAELHVPVFAGGGATDDAKIRNFLGGGIIERKLLEPANKGFKKVTDHDEVGKAVEIARDNTTYELLKAAKAPIAKPGHEIAIMEYVTALPAPPHAYDETNNVARNALRQSIGDMVNDMNAVLLAAPAGVNALPGAFAGNIEYGVPPPNVWDGFAVANNLQKASMANRRNNIIAAMDDDLGVQISVGIIPKGIGKFLNKVGEDNRLTGNLTNGTLPLGDNNAAAWIRLLTRDAVTVANSIVSNIDTGVPVPHLFGPNRPDKAAGEIRRSKSLRGFVSLMVTQIFGLYLTSRRLGGGIQALSKNAVALLTRTPLTQVVRELDVAKRPDQWAVPQKNSLRDQIINRVTARLNQAPVNRAGPVDDTDANNTIGGGFDWHNWVDEILSDTTNADDIFNDLGQITRVDPHDHPNSKIITPVVGVAPNEDHPRPYKVKGVDKAKSGAIVNELRFIRDVQPPGLLALVDNVIRKVRDSNN